MIKIKERGIFFENSPNFLQVVSDFLMLSAHNYNTVIAGTAGQQYQSMLLMTTGKGSFNEQISSPPSGDLSVASARYEWTKQGFLTSHGKVFFF